MAERMVSHDVPTPRNFLHNVRPLAYVPANHKKRRAHLVPG